MPDLTRFIDRNPVLLNEIRELAEMPSLESVGESEHITGYVGARFHIVGSAFSPSLGKEMYVGRKTLAEAKNLDLYFIKSLSNLILLEEHCPEISELLPLFMGAVVDNDGKYKFMLMEDYSEGKRLKIWPAWSVQDKIPAGVKQLMKPADYDDLEGAFIFIDDKMRILDLDKLPWLPEYQHRAYQIMGSFRAQSQLLDSHLIRL